MFIPVVLLMSAVALAILLRFRSEWAINICLVLIASAVVYGLCWLFGVAWSFGDRSVEFIGGNWKEIVVMTILAFVLLGGALK